MTNTTRPHYRRIQRRVPSPVLRAAQLVCNRGSLSASDLDAMRASDDFRAVADAFRRLSPRRSDTAGRFSFYPVAGAVVRTILLPVRGY